VPNQASAPARALESEIVGRLAKFFPEATPVRVPIQLSRCETSAMGKGKLGRERWSPLEETVIEFGTAKEVFFQVKHRLEFADQVLVESKDGSFRGEASVVAAQYHPEATVVAARFLKQVPDWIVKS